MIALHICAMVGWRISPIRISTFVRLFAKWKFCILLNQAVIRSYTNILPSCLWLKQILIENYILFFCVQQISLFVFIFFYSRSLNIISELYIKISFYSTLLNMKRSRYANRNRGQIISNESNIQSGQIQGQVMNAEMKERKVRETYHAHTQHKNLLLLAQLDVNSK